MTPICFYHRADFDGVASAAIVKKFVLDCELVGIDYGDPFPWPRAEPQPEENLTQEQFEEQGFQHKMERRTVYLVDFSLKPDEMKRLNECSDLVWIDHHASSILAIVPLFESSRGADEFPRWHCVVGKAACELCWEWFTGGNDPAPEAVRLLGRYDVWDAKNPDWPRIEAFQFGMRSNGGMMDPVDMRWRCLFGDDPDLDTTDFIRETVDRGYAILSYRNIEAASQCADGAHQEMLVAERWFDASGKPTVFQFGRDDTLGEWFTARLICLNSLQRGSWQFNSVYDPSQHDAMCVYGQLKDGRWRVSLYSTKEEVDCGAICKALGGGGHKGAAGFICSELPWARTSCPAPVGIGGFAGEDTP